MNSIKLAFLTYPLTEEETALDAFQMKLVRYVSGRFDHVEIIFRDTDNPAISHACSIVQDGTVFFREKKYSRDGYQYLTVSGLTTAQVQSMENFCHEQAYKRAPFNFRGFYTAASPLPRKSNGQEWFCSELITTALQKGGLLQNYVAETMTPTAIYDAVSKTIPSSNVHKGTNTYFGKRLQYKFWSQKSWFHDVCRNTGT